MTELLLLPAPLMPTLGAARDTLSSQNQPRIAHHLEKERQTERGAEEEGIEDARPAASGYIAVHRRADRMRNAGCLVCECVCVCVAIRAYIHGFICG